jgi:hypothetical protein
MPGESPMNDLQNVWQNQPTEVFKMSADKLRRKAQQLDRKARMAALFSTAIAIILFHTWDVASSASPRNFKRSG